MRRMAEQASKMHHIGADCHDHPCSILKYDPEGRYPTSSSKWNLRALAHSVVGLIYRCIHFVALERKLARKRMGWIVE